MKWISAIPRKNWSPSQNSAVCSVHFQENEIIRYDVFKRKDGTIGKNLLRYPKLNKNAVPSIFPNLPGYLSKPSVSARKTPDERRQNYIDSHNEIIHQLETADIIQNFDQLLNEYSNKLELVNWIVHKAENKIYFYQLKVQENQDSLLLETQISINENMVVQVFLGKNKLNFNDLKWILPFDLKLSRWSQLENILARYKENFRSDTDIFFESFNYLMEKSLKYLDLALTVSCEKNLPHSKNLEILIDQLKQITLKKNRYSSSTIIMAFLIHTTSHSTYELLRGFFMLPNKRYLQRISSGLNVSPNNDIHNNNYISNIFSNLTPREKVVVLLIDEIYITPRLDYRSKNLIGYAANRDSLAKTVLAFMISSAFGNFHEIVKLVSVDSISGSEIIPFATCVIDQVQKCGFEILCIITDNCRINQTMFKKLSNSNFIPNPSKTGKTIFLSYDFVHVMKNIRNNWFNLKNLDKTFVYPDFETGLIKYAKLSDVRKVYEAEKNSIIKKAYKLNFKTLFPNSFERQKVSLVDNLFHDTTIAALKDFGFNDTADFLQLIRNWWDIVNNTSVIKGIVRRNEFSKPISNEDDDYRVKFLEKFVVWINKWHDLDSNGHLTNDNYKAFVQSTATLLDVIRLGIPAILISDNGPQFDCLEFKNFAEVYDFTHITASPNYPQSNGMVKRQKETVKKLFYKALDEKPDSNLVLLMYRNSLLECAFSLAQLLMSRNLRDILPTTDNYLEPKYVKFKKFDDKIKLDQQKQKVNYDKKCKILKPIEVNENVRYQDKFKTKWQIIYLAEIKWFNDY
ncbi:uncharacterized protein LOC123686148 [Harmonia axyridis]|uniref:uncharacterized protein LOC123686148 n=1 Tax=Harmonia axyridis TaxID=115357 RepID=UPI001E278B62|nr:uncharacterized protein LOC123686148 [Harmonia axyridis]